jgi:hypothetical protein
MRLDWSIRQAVHILRVRASSEIIKGQMGGYIYTKIDQDNTWQPIYIGQGDIGVRCTQSHLQIECIDSKGATHVHLKITTDEYIRKSQERDLLAAYPQAYAPAAISKGKGRMCSRYFLPSISAATTISHEGRSPRSGSYRLFKPR